MNTRAYVKGLHVKNNTKSQRGAAGEPRDRLRKSPGADSGGVITKGRARLGGCLRTEPLVL